MLNLLIYGAEMYMQFRLLYLVLKRLNLLQEKDLRIVKAKINVVQHLGLSLGYRFFAAVYEPACAELCEDFLHVQSHLDEYEGCGAALKPKAIEIIEKAEKLFCLYSEHDVKEKTWLLLLSSLCHCFEQEDTKYYRSLVDTYGFKLVEEAKTALKDSTHYY